MVREYSAKGDFADWGLIDQDHAEGDLVERPSAGENHAEQKFAERESAVVDFGLRDSDLLDSARPAFSVGESAGYLFGRTHRTFSSTFNLVQNQMEASALGAYISGEHNNPIREDRFH